jgi:hypothetical protein
LLQHAGAGVSGGLASRKRPPTVARSPKVIQNHADQGQIAWFRITFGDLVVIAMATGGGIAGTSRAVGLNASNGPSAVQLLTIGY